MNRITEKITKTAVMLFALCLTSGAWAAAPMATAVWEGNFDVPQNGYSITLPSGMTYSKGTTGNIVISSSATTGAVIELDESTDWKVSVLIKYSHLYAVSDKKVSLATVKDSAGNVLGIRSTANGALTTTGFYNGSDSGYDFVSGQRAQSGSGYLLFSYNPNDGTFAYTGRTINSLSGGKNGTLRWGGKYIDKLTIGGPVTAGKTEAWAGVVIEKVALFVGEAYTNENIADYAFPSQTRWHDTDTYAYRGASSGSYFHLSNLEPVDCFDTLEGDNITLDASTDSYYWKKFASNQGATYYKAPGCALFYDKTGYTAQADCTFGPLSFGGLYVTSEQTSGDNPVYYSIIGSGDRTTELGDPDGKTETYFVFDKSFTIRRSGDKTVDTKLYGVVNVAVTSDMTFDLNSEPYSSGQASIKSVLTTAGTTAPVLKMSGGGKFKVYELDASIGTLDFSGVTATPFIEGNLTVTKDTKLVFPAGTAEGDSYVMCSGTLVAPTGALKTTVQVGDGSPFTGYVTYNAVSKSVSYSTTPPSYTCTVDGSSATWSVDGLTADNFAAANVTFTGSGTVEFGADANSITVGAGVTVIASSPSLSATVMLSDATSVLRMGTTGTLSGGISGSGVLEIADSVEIMVPLSVTFSHTGGTTIGDNAKLTAPYASSAWGYSVTGGNTARVVLTGTSDVTSAAKSGFQSSSTWTGTVELGSFYIANLFLTHYGNASSTVCANGTSTYFPSDGWSASNNTTAQNVKAFEIGAGGLSMPVNDSYNKISKKRFLFPCKLTGTGTFTLGLNAYNADEYNYVVFTGDVSEFQGVFSTGTGNGGRPPACVVFAATGTSYPTLSSETLSRFASDSGSFHFLSGKTVTFNANSTWTAKGGCYVDGTLTGSGALTVSSINVAANATMSPSGTIACNGDMTIGGTVTVPADKTWNVGAKANGTTVDSGHIRVTKGGKLIVNGTVEIKNQYTNWFDGLYIEDGGVVEVNSTGYLRSYDSVYEVFRIYGDLIVHGKLWVTGYVYVFSTGHLIVDVDDDDDFAVEIYNIYNYGKVTLNKLWRFFKTAGKYILTSAYGGEVVYLVTDDNVSATFADITTVLEGSGTPALSFDVSNLTSLPSGGSATTLLTTSAITPSLVEIDGHPEYYVKQDGTTGAVTLQLYAAKDSAGVYYDDVAEAFNAIVEDPTLTVTILDGTEASYAETLASNGLGRNGTQVFHLVAERLALDGSVIAQYPTAQAAIEADSGDSIVAIYETATVTARVAPFYIKPVGISLDDITINCVYAGFTYDEFTDLSGYGGNYVGVYAVQRHASPATFTWNPEVDEGDWNTVANWTSDDGEVLSAPNNSNYTVILGTAASINTGTTTLTLGKMEVGAAVSITGQNQSPREFSFAEGIVFTSESSMITLLYSYFADGTVMSTTVPGKYVRFRMPDDYKYYDVVNSAATVYDAEDNVVNGYNSLADAVAAAADGQKVKLFANRSDNATINDKSITFIEGSYTFSGTFTGNGTVVLGSALKSADPARWAAGWTGIVELKDITTVITDFDFADYGNANSTVRANNVLVRMPETGGEYGNVGEINLVGEGLRFGGDPIAGQDFTFSAAISGTGKIRVGTRCQTASPAHTRYIFKGDLSDFEGGVDYNETGWYKATIVFQDGTDEIPAGDNGEWGQIILTENTSISLGGEMYGPAGIIVAGTINVLSGGSVRVDSPSGKQINGAGTITYATLPESAPAFNNSWTGTVVLPSFAASGQDFNNFGVEGSKVQLTGITGGWLDMGAEGSDYTIKPEVVLAGNMTLTDSSNRSWIFKKVSGTGVSGTGNLSFTPGASDRKITIRINDLASTVGTISNNMGVDTTWTIDKISFPAATALPVGTKLLSTGGNGTITLGSITVGGVALSNVSYSRNTSGAEGDGFYVNAAATTTGTGESAVTTVTTDGSTTSVAVTLDNDYSGKIAVPANVATLTVTGPTITAGQLRLVTTQGTYDNLLSYSAGTVSLDPSAFYQNGEGEANKIYVEPKTAASDPMTMPGATTAPAFNIKTIPGLYYAVWSGTAPNTLSAGSATQATTTTTGLAGPALGNEDTVRYYKISVGRTAAEAAQ